MSSALNEEIGVERHRWNPGAVKSDREPRRRVELIGFGALTDGTTFRITVLDLSYDGCRVESAIALFPGLKLKISITGMGGSLDAEVRWCRDGHAGLRFNPEEQVEDEQVPRKQERIEVAATLSLRRFGRANYQARLFDLTPTGCKVEFVERPLVDELLWVKFDGLDAIEAKVRWLDGFYGGVEFVRPIYPAVFEMLLAKLRA